MFVGMQRRSKREKQSRAYVEVKKQKNDELNVRADLGDRQINKTGKTGTRDKTRGRTKQTQAARQQTIRQNRGRRADRQ